MRIARLGSPVRLVGLGIAAKVAATRRLRGVMLQRRNARLAWASPLCVHCLAQGRTSRATQWDHITPLSEGGRESDANLQGLCDECHALKTAGELAERTGGRSRRFFGSR